MNLHYVASTTKGERCMRCTNTANHKVGEEISQEEALWIATQAANEAIPIMRHNFTAYLCCVHFRELFGSAVFCTYAELWDSRSNIQQPNRVVPTE